MNIHVDRRAFLAASGGLVLAAPVAGPAKAGTEAPTVTAFLRIGADGAITVLSPTVEMGQGTWTAHAAIIADELGVDLARVSVENPQPADPYRRGGNMGSAGSWGVRAWVGPLRKAAAQAREMLTQAAASRWGVPAGELTIRADGRVAHVRTGRTLPFADIAADAGKLTPPANPALRPAASRRYVGTDQKRLDTPAKVRGTHIYAQDLKLDGMLYACARLSPVFKAEVERFDAASAKAVPGVVDVVAVPWGAAVVATSTWAAMRGADALQISWKPTGKENEASADISATIRAGLDADGDARVARREGDVDAAFKGAARVITADYEVPYLAHMCMEPWSCTARFTGDRLEVWAPTQGQDRVLQEAAVASGLKPEAITVHSLQPGGGFGLRLVSEHVPAAVICAKAMGRPVKYFHRREDEIGQARYRPVMAARLSAALSADNRIIGLTFRTCGPSLARQIGGRLPDGQADWAAVQNMGDVRYDWGAVRYDNVVRDFSAPLAAWRAVGATHNAWFVEAFMDELARAAGEDPVAFRLKHLSADVPRQARARRVVERVAQAANWGTPLADGRKRAIAHFESYGALCAHVAEGSLENGMMRVHKVTCVLDAGEVVMPDQARQQVEGGVVQGLSAALFEAAPIANGRSVKTNFDSYRVMRINEAPQVETVFLNSGETIGGVGEPPTPPAIAVAGNLMAALTGQPVRSMPLVKDA